MKRQRLIPNYTGKCFLFLLGRWCVSARPVVIGIVKGKRRGLFLFQCLKFQEFAVEARR